MQYTKKCSPEEQKSAKFSQAACFEEDSSDTDADPDLPGEANPTPPEPKQHKPKNSAPGSDTGHQSADKVHTEICGKAVKMMSKIEHILDKFDTDSSRTANVLLFISFPLDNICKRKN